MNVSRVFARFASLVVALLLIGLVPVPNVARAVAPDTFQVAFPSTVVAGTSGDFTVTAKTAGGATDTAYRGTVYVFTTDAQVDPASVLYTFGPADAGAHTFHVTFRTAGPQTVSVQDTTSGSTADAATSVTAAAATHFTVASDPGMVVTNLNHGYRVTAKDAWGNTDTFYAGVVHFTTSDPSGLVQLPPDAGLVGGTAHVTARLQTVGTRTLTATDSLTPSITGSVTVSVVNPAALDHIVVSPHTATIAAGGSQAFSATGYDASGSSLGDVTGATVFTIAGGTCEGNVCTSTAAGSHAVTGTDGTFVDSTASLSVTPAAFSYFHITPTFATIGVGQSQTYSAEGFDAYGNSRGDVTASTTFSSFPPGGVTCVGAVCTANTVAGSPYSIVGESGGAVATASLTVGQGTPHLTWSNPSAITYGTALDGTQLNAIANIPGSYAYTPAPGTMLNAGSHQALQVTFTPVDLVNYQPTSLTVYIDVNPATPDVSWATPSAITYGTPLSHAELNASTLLDGTLVYTPALGTVLGAGDRTLSVTFTPYDANYGARTVTVTLHVNPAELTVQPDAAMRAYGVSNPMFHATISEFVNGEVLGTSDVTGTPSCSSAATAGSAPGGYPINCTQGTLASTNYTFNLSSSTLTVTKAHLTVTADNKSRPHDTADPAFTATLSGFTNGETRGTSDVTGAASCSTSAARLDPVGAYSITCTAGTLASSHYDFTTFVAGTLTIGRTDPTITWSDPAAITYGTALSRTQLNATAGVPGTFSYAPPLGTVLTAGSQPITVTFTPTDTADYNTVSKTVHLQVNRATPTVTWSDPAGITYGTLLDGTQLSATASVDGTFVYQQPAGTRLNAGLAQPLTVTFTPDDTTNWEVVVRTVHIDVAPRAITVTAVTHTRTYNGTTVSILLPSITSGSLASGDVAHFSQAFDTKDVGTDKTLTPSGYVADGNGGANYSVTFVPVSTGTITKRSVTIVANDAQGKVYGASDPVLTYRISSGSLVLGDSFSGSLSRVAGEGVGSYAITQGTVALSANYTLRFVSRDFAISKAVLTVTAENKRITYGDADPAFTFGYSGFAFSDNASNLTAEPTCSVSGAHANAGAYGIACSGGSAANYSFSYVGGTLTVDPRAIEVTATAGQTKTYGDADPGLGYAITSGALVGADGFTGSLTRDSGEDAGMYAIRQGTLTAGSNYTLTFVSNDFEIARRVIVASPDSFQHKVYGDTDPVLTYQYGGTLVGADAFSGAPSRDAGENVGSYAINQGTLALSTNYDLVWLVFVPVTFEITPRPITVTADSGQGKVYGHADPAFTYTITSGSLAGTDTLSGDPSRASGESVGDYAILPGSLTAGSNYALTFVSADFTIAKAELTITADDQEITYGDSDPAFTFRYAGFAGTDSGANLDAEPTCSVSGPHANAGSYTIECSGAAGANYLFTYVDGTLTVHARAIEVTADPGQSKTYGGSDPSFTYAITSGSLVGSDFFLGALGRDAGENVGDYAINQGSLTAGPNYDLTFVGATFSITQRVIYIQPSGLSKVYGDPDPTFAYTIIEGSLVGSDTLTGALSRAPGETVGSYAITFGTLTAGPNYDLRMGIYMFMPIPPFGMWTIVPAPTYFSITVRPIEVTIDSGQAKVYGDPDPSFTYTVTSGSLVFGDAFSGSLSREPGENVGTYIIDSGTLALSSNYSLSVVDADFTITARPVTVTATVGQSKMYGDADPVFAWTLTSGSLVFGDMFSGALTRVAGENAGYYAIGQGTLALSTNYTLTFVSHDFAITARPITVTANAGQSKVYGNADPVFAWTVTSGSLADGDVLSGALGRVAGENVGNYAITQGTLTGGSNYDLTFVGRTFAITARSLTITASSATVTYGEPVPAVTAAFSGLASGDTVASVVVALPGCSTTATAGSPVGSYATSCTGGRVSANYSVSYAGGSISIGAAPLTVTASSDVMRYGAAVPAITPSYSGLVNGDTIASVVSVAPTCSTLATSTSPVDTYASTCEGGSVSANYDVHFIAGGIEVLPAPLLVMAWSGTTPYGTVPTITAEYFGFVAGDTSASLTTPAICTSDVTTTSTPGRHGSWCHSATDANYSISFMSGYVDVVPASLVVIPSAATMVYGSSVPTITPTYFGFVNGEDVSVLTSAPTCTTFATSTSPVAVYLSRCSGGSAANYALVDVYGTVTVTKAPLTVTPAATGKTYGAPVPTIAPSYAGFLNGDTAAAIMVAPTCTTTATTASAVAAYPASCSGGSATNYVFTYATGTFTVTKAAATITASSPTMVKGGTVPTISPLYSGLVLGESAPVVTGAPTCSTTATAASVLGSYPSTCSGAVSPNYTFSYVSGSVTVANPTLSGVLRTYGGTPMSGATIGLYDASGRGLRSVTTDGSGRYSFSVAAGTYKLYIIPNAAGYTNQWWGGTSASSATTIAATTSNVAQDLVAYRWFTLTGTVSVSGGAPVAGAQVSVYDAATGAYVKTVTADGSGVYSTTVREGSYKLYILPGSGYPNQWWGGSSKSTATVVTVTANKTQDVTVH